MGTKEEVIEDVKKFLSTVNSSRLKDKIEGFGLLEKRIVNGEVSENVLKVAFKLLLQTACYRYQDIKSLLVMKNFVKHIAVGSTQVATVKSFTSAVSVVLKPTSIPMAGYRCASWILSFMRCSKCEGWDDATFKGTIEALSLCSLVCLQLPQRYAANFQRKFFLAMKIPGVLKKTLEILPSSIGSECRWLSFVSLLISCCKSQNSPDPVEGLKKIGLDLVEKQLISVKVKPPQHVVKCVRPITSLISVAEFETFLFPSMKKFLLRNPELVMTSVAEICSQLSIDLSPYALELVKPMASQLHSKDPDARDQAEEAIKFVTTQISDKDSLSALLKHLFAVLNGSEGAIATFGQKVSVLKGVANLSQNGICGAKNVQTISQDAVAHLVEFLKQETHEVTISEALKTLSVWGSKIDSEMPPSIREYVKTTMKQNVSPVVRLSCLQMVIAVCQESQLASVESLLQVFVDSFDRGVKQPLMVPVVSESLAAALLIVKISSLGHHLDTTLAGFWKSVFDKFLFTSSKFLTAIPDDVLLLLVNLTERLLLEHSVGISPEFLHSYYGVLLYCLTERSYVVRKAASKVVKRQLSLMEGPTVSLELVDLFSALLSNAQTSQINLKSTVGDESSPEVADGRKRIDQMPKLFSEAFLLITSLNQLDSDTANRIAIKSMVAANHPIIVQHDPYTWLKLIGSLALDSRAFVERNWDIIANELMSQAACEKVAENMAGLLTQISPDFVVKKLLDATTESLQDPEIPFVSPTDFEIFKFPEGQLFDKSVLQSDNDQGKDANIRRESKLYSYKDQMAEIEIRKELERKKKLLNPMGEPELTPKQKEQMRIQLQKEAAIRANVAPLHAKCHRALSLISAGMKGNPLAFSPFVTPTLRVLEVGLKSPVSADNSVQCWRELSQNLFRNETLGCSVTFTALRMLKPACKLDPRWCEEPLELAVPRVMDALLVTAGICYVDRDNEDGGDVDSKSSSGSCLPASSVSFCFPFVRSILSQKRLTKEKKTVEKAVLFMESHLCHYVADDNGGSEIAELPLEEMISLFVSVVGSAPEGSVLQQAAASCLAEVARAASLLSATTHRDVLLPLVKELLNGLFAPSICVREFSLKGLREIIPTLREFAVKSSLRSSLAERLWISRFDENEANATLAEKLWGEVKCRMDKEVCEMVLDDVTYHVASIRSASSDAFVAAITDFPDKLSSSLDRLLALYKSKLTDVLEPVKDEFGRLVAEGGVDQWEARLGIAGALKKVCPILKGSQVMQFFSALVPEAILDRNIDVRNEMLSATISGVKEHGKEHISELLPMFEQLMDTCPDSDAYDTLRQSIVVLLGTLAQHLDSSDPRVRPIAAKLIESLSTPSQKVQESVANCLPPLIPAIREQAPELAQKLLYLLLEADQYGERRGAAYGIAGIVKGLGILSLKQLNIMQSLSDAIQDKKVAKHREGALLAFEMLCNMLGRLFEPYVVHLLPNLLICFGDQDQHVRQAAEDCSKAIMRQLSAHGVKLVLPSLLAALEEDSWRTKCGSVELLGAMAFCAPKQLSACLPAIVPKLIEVLSDTHIRVQKAGEQALKHIGQVIRNPEILAISDVLLSALSDPTGKTSSCLRTLSKTKFVHYMDAPSLALIMPIVHRAFDDRSTETRRLSALIVANIYELADRGDFLPYLPQVLPGIKKSLLDPVPEVRGVAAKAFGAIVKGMGQEGYDEMLPWLKSTLVTPNNPVDRSGAAQGLCEVMGALGLQKLTDFMPEILDITSRADVEPFVRDGYIMMFIYLPSVYGDKFLPYLPKIVPSLLQALADENEYVRDTSLRAGQRLIHVYSESAIELLLPSLEKGLFDNNWRIRYSSVQLIGDLLFKISGVSGKMSAEGGEDETFGTEVSSKAISEALGEDHRNRILSGLYMARSDVGLLVRQSAAHVWKVIVANTPRTVKELLPTLCSLLLGCLASSSYDKQQIAARCLGELVKKQGERILIDIVPVLEEGLKSDDSDQRQGVCIALAEIMASTTKEMVLIYAENLIPTVRVALCDPLPVVRQEAAKTFEVLHSTIGPQALDDVITPLLSQLEDPQLGANTLDGLRKVMELKGKVVLPYLIPKLVHPPVNTHALSQLASVAGDALSRHLSKVLPALMASLASNIGTDKQESSARDILLVFLSVTDEYGVNAVIDVMLSKTAENDEKLSRASALLLSAYCQQAKVNLKPHSEQLFKGIMLMFRDNNEEIIVNAADALIALAKTFDAKEQLEHVGTVRAALKQICPDIKSAGIVPGFNNSKGLQPVLGILREGILNGSAELKETSAAILSDVIQVSSEVGLKPHVINVTGPLIRVLGDRYPPSVKVAILGALGLLLKKVGPMVKAFLPQLQSTFVKALQDPTSRGVRLKAGSALSFLGAIHPKVDVIIAEMFNNAKSADDNSVKETFLVTLRGLLEQAGSKVTPETRSLLVSGLPSFLKLTDDNSRTAAAAALGTLIGDVLSVEEADSVLREHLLNTDVSIEWETRHGNSVALQVAAKKNPAKLMGISEERLQKAVVGYITGDRVPICSAGLRAAAFLLKQQIADGLNVSNSIVTAVARSVNHNSTDIKTLASAVCNWLGRVCDNIDLALLKVFVPAMVNGTKEKNSAVRCNSEEALVALLQLRKKSSSVYENLLNIMDVGGKESLADCYTKTLQKVAKGPEHSLEGLDDTVQV